MEKKHGSYPVARHSSVIQLFCGMGKVRISGFVSGSSAYTCHNKPVFLDLKIGMQRKVQLTIGVKMLIIQSWGNCTSVSY